MDSATAPATPQPSHDDDAKWALLLEYDAADFRGRHELLDRERITVRDIARWRRETAKLRASNGNAGPVRAAKSRAGKAASAGADAPPESAPQPTPEEQPTGVGRSRRRSKSAEGAPPPPPGPLSALRSDVVAAHASALVYHADALSRLMAEAPASAAGYRRRSSPIERLTAAAQETSAAAREVLSARRRSGVTDAPARDSVDVSSELTDMLSTLTDYSSLAVAVQLLARELAPGEQEAVNPRRTQPGERNRRPWWGAEEADAPTESAPRRRTNPRQPHKWGSRNQDDGD